MTDSVLTFVRQYSAGQGRGSRRIHYTCVAACKQYVALGATTGSVYCFDVDSGQLLQVLANEEGHVTCLAFSPDENHLAVGTKKGRVVVLVLNFGDLKQRAKRIKSYGDLHKGSPISCMAWDGRGSRLASADSDGKLVLAASPTSRVGIGGQMQMIFEAGSSISQMEFQGNLILCSSLEKTLVCDTHSKSVTAVGSKARNARAGTCFAYDGSTAQDEECLLFAARKGSRLWLASAETGQVMMTLKFSEFGNSSSLTGLPEGVVTPSSRSKASGIMFDHLHRVACRMDHVTISDQQQPPAESASEIPVAVSTLLGWVNDAVVVLEVTAPCPLSLDKVTPTNRVLAWYNLSGDITDVAVSGRDIYVLVAESKTLLRCSWLPRGAAAALLARCQPDTFSQSLAAQLLSTPMSSEFLDNVDLASLDTLLKWLSSHQVAVPTDVTHALETQRAALEAEASAQTQEDVAAGADRVVRVVSQAATRSSSPAFASVEASPAPSRADSVTDNISAQAQTTAGEHQPPSSDIEQAQKPKQNQEEAPATDEATQEHPTSDGVAPLPMQETDDAVTSSRHETELSTAADRVAQNSTVTDTSQALALSEASAAIDEQNQPLDARQAAPTTNATRHEEQVYAVDDPFADIAEVSSSESQAVSTAKQRKGKKKSKKPKGKKSKGPTSAQGDASAVPAQSAAKASRPDVPEAGESESSQSCQPPVTASIPSATSQREESSPTSDPTEIDSSAGIAEDGTELKDAIASVPSPKPPVASTNEVGPEPETDSVRPAVDDGQEEHAPGDSPSLKHRPDAVSGTDQRDAEAVEQLPEILPADEESPPQPFAPSESKAQSDDLPLAPSEFQAQPDDRQHDEQSQQVPATADDALVPPDKDTKLEHTAAPLTAELMEAEEATGDQAQDTTKNTQQEQSHMEHVVATADAPDVIAAEAVPEATVTLKKKPKKKKRRSKVKQTQDSAASETHEPGSSADAGLELADNTESSQHQVEATSKAEHTEQSVDTLNDPSSEADLPQSMDVAAAEQEPPSTAASSEAQLPMHAVPDSAIGPADSAGAEGGEQPEELPASAVSVRAPVDGAEEEQQPAEKEQLASPRADDATEGSSESTEHDGAAPDQDDSAAKEEQRRQRYTELVKQLLELTEATRDKLEHLADDTFCRLHLGHHDGQDEIGNGAEAVQLVVSSWLVQAADGLHAMINLPTADLPKKNLLTTLVGRLLNLCVCHDVGVHGALETDHQLLDFVKEFEPLFDLEELFSILSEHSESPTTLLHVARCLKSNILTDSKQKSLEQLVATEHSRALTQQLKRYHPAITLALLPDMVENMTFDSLVETLGESLTSTLVPVKCLRAVLDELMPRDASEGSNAQAEADNRISADNVLLSCLGHVLGPLMGDCEGKPVSESVLCSAAAFAEQPEVWETFLSLCLEDASEHSPSVRQHLLLGQANEESSTFVVPLPGCLAGNHESKTQDSSGSRVERIIETALEYVSSDVLLALAEHKSHLPAVAAVLENIVLDSSCRQGVEVSGVGQESSSVEAGTDRLALLSQEPVNRLLWLFAADGSESSLKRFEATGIRVKPSSRQSEFQSSLGPSYLEFAARHLAILWLSCQSTTALPNSFSRQASVFLTNLVRSCGSTIAMDVLGHLDGRMEQITSGLSGQDEPLEQSSLTAVLSLCTKSASVVHELESQLQDCALRLLSVVDGHLWTRQPAALGPSLRQAADDEYSQQVSQPDSPKRVAASLSGVPAPPAAPDNADSSNSIKTRNLYQMDHGRLLAVAGLNRALPRTLEDAGSHWGVATTFYDRDRATTGVRCPGCSLPISSHTPGDDIMVFDNGVVYHEACNPHRARSALSA